MRPVWASFTVDTEIINRACCKVCLFYIRIGELAVVPRHLQAGVPQQPLQAEGIGAISQEVDGCCMSQRMRATSNTVYGGFLSIQRESFLDTALGKLPAIGSEEQIIMGQH